MAEIQEVDKQGNVEKKRRFDKRDFDFVADYIADEFAARKKDPDRVHLEKTWKEIDRQIRMEPDVRYKFKPDGSPAKGTTWMPELELPNQAQTLEVLTADARKLMKPDSGLWFAAHVCLTDDYLKNVDFESLVAGDDNEVPSQINQDNADKLTEGWLQHYHAQYDFWGNVDRLNAEAFKYGTFVGRGRNVTKSIFINTADGIIKRDQRVPVLIPRSIKSTYLDRSPQVLANEGMMVGPGIIAFASRRLVDLQLEAFKGSTDPEDEDGGWMPSNVSQLVADDKGHVDLLEYEGDIVVPRKTVRSIFVPNVIVTVAVGKGSKAVVRWRESKNEMGSYLIQPYHMEGSEEVYGVSPLMKGMPVQKAATEALNRLMGWAVLNTEPPVRYDKDDPFFAQGGGPTIEPRALWATMGKAETVEIGDGEGLLKAYMALLLQYSDVTGVNAPRLGAQTISHTTAFSKQVELQRGQSRTVDYTDTALNGAMHRWLQMEFALGKKAMKGTEWFYIDAYGGWVEIQKKHLPEYAEFEAFGAGEPQEEMAKQQKKWASLQQAVQLDALKVQYQLGKPMNYDAIQKEMLLEGGWQNVDEFLGTNRPDATALPGGVQAGASGVGAVPSPATGIGPAANTALVRLLGNG